ncbi:hypothetical protein DMUE_3145 [Dictyocoela muelleri]|nr:hypothetical protein DMUE_3145 [Dictyocoela muelleri]
MPIRINDVELNAMINTGANINYISTDIVTKIKLESHELESLLPSECANGEVMNIRHTAKIRFKCAAYKDIEYLGVHYVLPKNKYSVIFGMSFLKQNIAEIDLKNNLITLDGR